MAEKKKKSTKKAPAKAVVSADVEHVLSETDLSYAGLTNMAREIKDGARLVRDGEILMLEIAGVRSRRLKLAKYLRVQIGPTQGKTCKYIPRAGGETVQPAEALLPEMTLLEKSLVEMLAEKTQVRFEE
jgi:hypothetical protein